MSFTFASRQRTLRRICALTLAGAMLLPATPLLAVNAHADSGVAVAAEQNQSTGNITWGIKTSFRNYIGEPYKVSEGASYNSTDLFTFPNQETKVSEDGNQVSLQGSGKVQYISHCTDRNKPEAEPNALKPAHRGGCGTGHRHTLHGCTHQKLHLRAVGRTPRNPDGEALAQNRSAE